jgi:hypothetical protein
MLYIAPMYPLTPYFTQILINLYGTWDAWLASSLPGSQNEIHNIVNTFTQLDTGEDCGTIATHNACISLHDI